MQHPKDWIYNLPWKHNRRMNAFLFRIWTRKGLRFQILSNSVEECHSCDANSNSPSQIIHSKANYCNKSLPVAPESAHVWGLCNISYIILCWEDSTQPKLTLYLQNLYHGVCPELNVPWHFAFVFTCNCFVRNWTVTWSIMKNL